MKKTTAVNFYFAKIIGMKTQESVKVKKGFPTLRITELK